ncbi:MAG: tetratricopeptide repeat protein [Desulfobacteraceae bacterium]|nr:MAG: tetratricopeptide repeat protein [Desulfobacteraceae bacterium]
MEPLLPLIFAIVLGLIVLVSTVMWILVVIKLFKNGGALFGILGIVTCGLFAFIYGWVKHKEWKLTKIMLVWTGCYVIFIVLYVILGASVFMMYKGKAEQIKATTPQAQSTPATPINKSIKVPIARPESTVATQPGTTPGTTTTAPVTSGTTTTTPQPAVMPIPEKTGTTAAATASILVAGKTIDYDLELKNLENLIKLNDKNADNFYNRGFIYHHKGELQLAEKDYTKAIELNPKHEDAYYNRGLVNVKNENFEQAIKDFSEAIKLRPNAADAYCNRGNAYFQADKIEMALLDYNEAVKLSPVDADLYYNQGLAFLKQKNQDKAQNAFRTAVGLGHVLAKKYLESPTN